MRGMVCGMLAPSDPMKASHLAHIDGTVSHSRNGIYGEIFSSVLTSLAFDISDIRVMLKKATDFIPAKSEYAAHLEYVIQVLATHQNQAEALSLLNKRFEQYNWIHAYPNMADDVFALWYGNGDFTESMSLLAKAGNDVDCNAGLVGNVLGIMHGVPPAWGEPIGDLLETYIIGKEKLSIRNLSVKTSHLAELHR
jgi:ADP-ribosylglycohydrolase